MLFLHVDLFTPTTLSIKALAPLVASAGGQTSATLSPLPSPVAGFWIIANFPFHQPGLFIGFWAASSWTRPYSLGNSTELKLKLQCFGHLMQRANLLEKTLMLGKIEGKRRRGRQRTRWLDGITDSMDMNLRKFWEIVKDRGAWHAFVHGVSRSPTWPSNCTTTQQQQGFSHGKIQRDGITCGGSTWNKGTSVRDTALVHTQTWTYSSDIDRHQTNK